MNSLDKQKLTDKAKVVKSLRKSGEALTDAIEELNSAMRDAWTAVSAALDTYNANVEEVRTFRDGVLADMENYFEGRTAKWQASENGENFQSWMESWNINTEDVTVDEPSEIAEPDLSLADIVEDLPEKP